MGCAIVAVIAIIIFSKCFLSVDSLGYQEVLERANPALSFETDRAYKASQQRKGVQKEYWHSLEDQRLEVHLSCSDAELVYEKEGEKQVIVEYMKNIRCFIQEELFYLSPEGEKTVVLPENAEGYSEQQTVRYVVADSAKYHYTSETLVAGNVDMVTFTAPGHKLPRSVDDSKLAKRASAEKLTLSFIEKTLKFNAEKFKGAY